MKLEKEKHVKEMLKVFGARLCWIVDVRLVENKLFLIEGH